MNVIEYALDNIEDYQRSPDGLGPLIALQVGQNPRLLRSLSKLMPFMTIHHPSSLACLGDRLDEILYSHVGPRAARH